MKLPLHGHEKTMSCVMPFTREQSILVCNTRCSLIDIEICICTFIKVKDTNLRIYNTIFFSSFYINLLVSYILLLCLKDATRNFSFITVGKIYRRWESVCSVFIVYYYSYIFYLLSFTYAIYYNLFIIWEL